MKRKITRFILLIVILSILALNFIIIRGKEYTLVIDNNDFSNMNINDINTIQNGDSVSLIDKKIVGKNLELTYRAISKGVSTIEITTNETFNYEKLVVGNFKVIFRSGYFGDCNGDEVIPITTSILLCTLIIMIYDSYKKSINKSLYQYKNMYLLGLIIFLLFSFINQVNSIFNYGGIYETLDRYVSSFSTLSIILLPLGLITFIFVSISNIILIKKEGFSIRNTLGIMLGIFLCFLTLLPDFMYRFTYNDFLIDIHQMGSVPYYIYTFLESSIYSFVSYLECILIAVIILSVKASRRIPKFNKDYIIILGCMINKDGSLTKLLKSRADRAIEFSKMQKEKANKDITFICSGGKGNDEPISEGLAIKNYLVECGINEKRIIVEDKSTNTYENFKYSINKIKGKKELAYSTTNFHVFRAGVEAYSLNKDIEGIGSKTKRYFWINAFIREFIATLYYEKKNHLIILVLILLLNLLVIIIMNISGVI